MISISDPLFWLAGYDPELDADYLGSHASLKDYIEISQKAIKAAQEIQCYLGSLGKRESSELYDKWIIDLRQPIIKI
jgi:hypothetical protein